MEKETSDRLISFLEGMLPFYRKFLEVETNKYQDLAAGKLDSLNAHVRREEAFVLKARGMEQERQRLLEEAGLGGKTFRESIPSFPAEEKDRLEKLYRDLSGTVGQIRAVNSKNSSLTRLKLGQISQILSRLENNPELKRIYGEKLNAAAPADSFYSKKV